MRVSRGIVKIDISFCIFARNRNVALKVSLFYTHCTVLHRSAHSSENSYTKPDASFGHVHPSFAKNDSPVTSSICSLKNACFSIRETSKRRSGVHCKSLRIKRSAQAFGNPRCSGSRSLILRMMFSSRQAPEYTPPLPRISLFSFSSSLSSSLGLGFVASSRPSESMPPFTPKLA